MGPRARVALVSAISLAALVTVALMDYQAEWEQNEFQMKVCIKR